MLARLAGEVMTIEYLPGSKRARKLLVDDMGIDNVTFLVGMATKAGVTGPLRCDHR